MTKDDSSKKSDIKHVNIKKRVKQATEKELNLHERVNNIFERVKDLEDKIGLIDSTPTLDEELHDEEKAKLN